MIPTLALLLGTALLLLAIRSVRRRRRVEALLSILGLYVGLAFVAMLARDPDRFRRLVESLRPKL